MAFEWLERFQRGTEKGARYAEKARAAYRLGARGGGALAGVSVRAGAGCCAAAAALEAEAPRAPADAPILPLDGCDRPGACRCAYRPVMTYEVETQHGRAASPGTVVVGADGFVGSALARALGATRVVYRADPLAGELHVSRCAAALGRADVVAIAHGFRVRPGCGYEEYRRSHELATAALLPLVRPGALVLHVSSASVLGRGGGLGNRSLPDPATFPSPGYATAKLEEDHLVARAAAERGLRAVLLRPAVLYDRAGAGMVDTLLRLARRGVALRLYPREARHHLCHMELLGEVARRVVARPELPSGTTLVVADPYTVTNAELEAMVADGRPGRRITVPLPLPWLSALLRRAPSSRSPRLDLRTRGEILGVLHMDTVYDPTETFALLGIDPADWTLERTLRPVIAEALAS